MENDLPCRAQTDSRAQDEVQDRAHRARSAYRYHPRHNSTQDSPLKNGNVESGSSCLIQPRQPLAVTNA